MSKGARRRVVGTVTKHEPYGFYVDFGDEQDGLVVITMVVDDPNISNPVFPPIGFTIEAVLLGYTDLGNQPRLSTRPVDIDALE